MLLSAQPQERRIHKLTTQYQNITTNQFNSSGLKQYSLFQPNASFQSPPVGVWPRFANESASLESPSSATTEFPNPHEEILSPTRSHTSHSQLTSLVVQLKTIDGLQETVKQVKTPSVDPSSKISWCRDVLFLLNRENSFLSSMNDPLEGRINLTDIRLSHLVVTAISIIIELSSVTGTPIPPYAAEAIYMRALLAATGAFPEHVKSDPRAAFRGFEAAARAGYEDAWFTLGRDYEKFQEVKRAKSCFDRGVKLDSVSCIYRLGISYLFGQLGNAQSSELSLPLLHRAASLATLAFPHPAYLYGLLLLDDLADASIPSDLFAPYIPTGSSPTLEGRKYLERAAHLHFAPAQYKLGYAYELAKLSFHFDPLLSIRYYSLASELGEAEASMALSRWFLCGSAVAGGFEKDEVLALKFAQQAAKQKLPSAEFAMGYYSEVGVGTPQDLDAAINWYRKALQHGHRDAAARLSALTEPTPQVLSRDEHKSITEHRLVRKRTLAKARSEAETLSSPYNGQTFPPQPHPSLYSAELASDIIDSVRRLSTRSQVPKAPRRKSTDETQVLLDGHSEKRSPSSILSPPPPEISPSDDGIALKSGNLKLDAETLASGPTVLSRRRALLPISQPAELLSKTQADLSSESRQNSTLLLPSDAISNAYKYCQSRPITPSTLVNSHTPTSIDSVGERCLSGHDEYLPSSFYTKSSVDSYDTSRNSSPIPTHPKSSSTLSSLELPDPNLANWPSTSSTSTFPNQPIISDTFTSEPQDRICSSLSTTNPPIFPVSANRWRSRLRGPRPSTAPGLSAVMTTISPPLRSSTTPSQAHEESLTDNPRPRAQRRPTTFAEMGIKYTTKAEDEGCIVS